MLGSGTTAPADETGTELGHEAGKRGCQLLWGERVPRAVRAELRQTRVRHDRYADAGPLRQVTQVLAHLGGPRRAVETDQIDAERLECGERRPDLGAEQHGAGGLDGDVSDDGQLNTRVSQGALGPDDRRLRLEQVLRRLDQ